jgi:hypothetical protein
MAPHTAPWTVVAMLDTVGGDAMVQRACDSEPDLFRGERTLSANGTSSWVLSVAVPASEGHRLARLADVLLRLIQAQTTPDDDVVSFRVVSEASEPMTWIAQRRTR